MTLEEQIANAINNSAINPSDVQITTADSSTLEVTSKSAS